MWAADIASLWSNEGWLYLAVVIDLYSRRVVGWAFALNRRAELACEAYQALLSAHGITPSMSHKGNCWDNAPVERFFGSLKRERADLRLFATRQEARACVIDYIEMLYNSRWRHSSLDYACPAEYEANANVA